MTVFFSNVWIKTLWTSSEADPAPESNAAPPAEKEEEAPAGEGEKPAE